MNYFCSRFSCINGSDMYGNDTIKCQHDGSWTKSPECLKRCVIPVIVNSNITHSNISSYANNSIVNVTCNDNAKLRGNSSITCVNGTWSSTPHCDIYRCYTPSVGPHASVENVTEYLINNTYNVTCDKGYNGSVTAYCKNGGTWNITGHCGIQTCPSVKVISNSEDKYNSTITYKWNDTFSYR